MQNQIMELLSCRTLHHLMLPLFLVVIALQRDSCAQELPPADTIWTASDTLSEDIDPVADAADCLKDLRWTRSSFQVSAASVSGDNGDLHLFFPSPRPIGDARNDVVCLEWYAARNETGDVIEAPAFVVIHESGRSMSVGRIFARGLNAMGFHTFMIHLPGYGTRRTELSDKPEFLLTGLRQGIADVRRARDAVASLPFVDHSRIALQGTSLGGFVAATVSGLDRGYYKSFVLLAGGNIAEVVLGGAKDAAKIRQKLQDAGISTEQIRQIARQIEPLRLAHRVDAQNTWLYSARYDTVVPPASSAAFAAAARLPAEHHIVMSANHYSGVLFLPAVFAQIRSFMAE